MNSLGYFFFKLVVLKAASSNKPISNFKHLQQRISLVNFQILKSCYFWVINSETSRNISWTFLIYYLYFFNVLTAVHKDSKQ